MVFSTKAYSQNNDIYSPLELIPDTDNRGINIFYRVTGITNEISVWESGWLNLSGYYFASEFYIKYYVEETQTVTIMILSDRGGSGKGIILYHNSWTTDLEGFGIDFFQRNNMPYMLIYYIGGTARYYEFAIFEHTKDASLLFSFNMIYGGTGLGGYFEFADGKIIVGGCGILNFNNGMYELIKK
jgi:hypothetical protein